MASEESVHGGSNFESPPASARSVPGTHPTPSAAPPTTRFSPLSKPFWRAPTNKVVPTFDLNGGGSSSSSAAATPNHKDPSAKGGTEFTEVESFDVEDVGQSPRSPRFDL